MSYASTQNERYNHKGSKFLDLGERFNSTISNLPVIKQKGIRATIANSIKEFQKNHPTITCFEDLELADACKTPMSNIFIDITIQRLLDLVWVATILKNFRAVQADPVKLYEVTEGGDLATIHQVGTIFASWDAQHTAIVYWIIAVMIYKQDPATVMVPSVVYKVKNKADVRMNFVEGNSKSGKKLLEAIDLYMQKVMGVRMDKSADPTWVDAELKQQYLEGADLFVTADKFGNTHEDGAISRMQEIDSYTSDVIAKFCLYTTTYPAPRPIDSQEIEIMCAWFDLARKSGIDYTDDEVIDLGNHLHSLPFAADFHESSTFWDQVRTAYQNWHTSYYAKVPESHRPKRINMTKNWNTGGAFLWHQLNKTWQGPMPELSSSSPFIPNEKDLY